MPVRVVLRGLILVSVDTNEDNPRKGTITARLIDGSHSLDDAVHASIMKNANLPKPDPEFEKCMRMHQGHHKHQGEMQVFDGDKARDAAGLISLGAGANIDIKIDEANENYVETEDSYDKFMPKLRKIADDVGLVESPKLNPDFISHTVTINRGVVRVRDVGDWDAGSLRIPKAFRKADDGGAVYQSAKVRFLKANVFGYVATECVVDIEDAKSVTVTGPKGLDGTYTGKGTPTRRVAEDTVEILISNYAPQQSIVLPWTLHYRWMYEAAGFNVPVDLDGPELDNLAEFAAAYDQETWDCESAMFLSGPTGKMGYPFPYRLPEMWRVPLAELDYGSALRLVHSDPGDPVRCPLADLSPGKT